MVNVVTMLITMALMLLYSNKLRKTMKMRRVMQLQLDANEKPQKMDWNMRLMYHPADPLTSALINAVKKIVNATKS